MNKYQAIAGDLQILFSTEEHPIALAQCAGRIKLWRKRPDIELPFIDESDGHNHYINFYFNTHEKAAREILSFVDGDRLTDRIKELIIPTLKQGVMIDGVFIKASMEIAGTIMAVTHIHKERAYLYQ